MHDPMTVAFTIPRPWPVKSGLIESHWYWPDWVTIWHVDPETDGSDDSCGWFMRVRHGDNLVRAQIAREFAFNWDASYGGWFNKDGSPRLSVTSIVLNMFHVAAWVVFKHNRRAADSFMHRRLYDILFFAENNVDSLHSSVTMSFGPEERQDRIDSFTGTIYSWILRQRRPWWRHPRWHLHHWKIQIHPVDAFKRWAFGRCSTCHRGFSWGYAPISDTWDSEGPRWFKSEVGIRHNDCCHPQSSGIGQVAQS